ncbi:MAG TPA: hypothetical protein VKR83_16370 [Ktedonobacteraceae bacterium]|nr:hypothetical protein [Ktedonobacteraceae bacterium]
MLVSEGNQSEVARLLEQISAEYEAAQRGLSGLAYGASKHDFITARMENMGHLHNQLQEIVGESAISLVAEKLSNLP